MSNIVPHTSYPPPSRLQRATSRELSHIDAANTVRLARLESEAEHQAAVVGGVAYVGRRALTEVALLSQMEQSLAQAIPHASGRLATIADVTAIGAAQIVADSINRLRK